MVSHTNDSAKSSSSNSIGSPLPCRKLNLEVDPKSREEANERERRRTKLLNDGFKLLRNHLPYRPADKMSKIKTLQIATQYMDFLSKETDPSTPHKTTKCSAESVAQLHAYFNAKREVEERASACSSVQCSPLPPFATKFIGIGRRNQCSSGLVKKERCSESHSQRELYLSNLEHSSLRSIGISNSSDFFNYINNGL